jgi:sulfur-carrier protein
MIAVRFFASLRDVVGCADASLDSQRARTVLDVWQAVCPHLALPPNTLMAVNLDYVAATHPVYDGDEVAFFPPVTGG